MLNDSNAPPALVALAGDVQAWTDLYLAALEEVGLLRPDDQAPPIRENPLVVSQMAAIASGLIAGPAGEEIRGSGNLLEFFDQIRAWYGHDPQLRGEQEVPDSADFDLGLTLPTHFEAFNIYVPFQDCRPDIPEFVEIPPVNFTTYLDPAAAGTARLATMTGPTVFGDEQYLPASERLPYTVYFQNAATSSRSASEVRIVTELDR